MRIKALVDLQIIDQKVVLDSLETLKNEYEGITEVTWNLESWNLDLPWIETDASSKIVVSHAIESICRRVNDELQGEYDYDIVMLFFHPNNWKGGLTYGWAVGPFFSNFQVCLINGVSDLKLLSYIVRHEVNHCMDNFAQRELGIDIAPMINLPTGSWDARITHGGLQPPYPYSVGDDYRGHLLKVQNIIREFFEIRKKKYELGLLRLIYQLYLRLRYLMSQTHKQSKVVTKRECNKI